MCFFSSRISFTLQDDDSTTREADQDPYQIQTETVQLPKRQRLRQRLPARQQLLSQRLRQQLRQRLQLLKAKPGAASKDTMPEAASGIPLRHIDLPQESSHSPSAEVPAEEELLDDDHILANLQIMMMVPLGDAERDAETPQLTEEQQLKLSSRKKRRSSQPD